MEEKNKEVVSMRQLLECGVHFGHQTKRWNPKMKKYIFTSRNGIHVIDLQQSIQLINVAYEFIKQVVKNDGIVLFVGTKKQAQDSIKDESTRCKMPYVNNRWLGGTLTNISTIRQSINKLKDFERQKEDGSLNELSKKEQSKKTKAYNKLLFNLEGIKDMIKVPSAIFIVDTKKEQLAIQEAQKRNIPIIGIVDTNADPNEVDYPIPANDDAIRAINLLCSVMANAVIDGEQEKLLNPAPKKEETADTAEKTETAPKKSSPEKAAKKETAKETKKETPKKTTEKSKEASDTKEATETKKEKTVKTTKAASTKKATTSKAAKSKKDDSKSDDSKIEEKELIKS